MCGCRKADRLGDRCYVCSESHRLIAIENDNREINEFKILLIAHALIGRQHHGKTRVSSGLKELAVI